MTCENDSYQSYTLIIRPASRYRRKRILASGRFHMGKRSVVGPSRGRGRKVWGWRSAETMVARGAGLIIWRQESPQNGHQYLEQREVGELTSEGNGVDPVCQISQRRRSSRLMISSLCVVRQLACGNNVAAGRKPNWK